MYRLLQSIFGCLIFLSGLSGQSYFSQDYDLDNFRVSEINGAITVDSNLYVAIYGYNYTFGSGTIVLSFDFDGNMLDSTFVSNFRPAKKESLLLRESDSLVIVGVNLSNSINDFSKVTLDLGLLTKEISLISELPDTTNYQLRGGVEIQGELFLYGTKQHIDSVHSKAFIYKVLPASQQVQLLAEFSEGRNLDLSQLNIIKDSILIVHTTATITTTTTIDRIASLFFFNFQGELLNKFSFEEFSLEFNSIVVDELGLYFNSVVVPGKEFSTSWKSERINRFDIVGDSLIWSSRLPEYTFFDIRSHTIHQMNSDDDFIYAIGSTGDRDTFTTAARYSFVSKVNKNGEYEWVRIFKKLDANNVFTSAPYSSKSELGYSLVVNSNQIINIGWSYYYTSDGGTDIKLWILSLDQNGCLPSEECNHRILLDDEKKGGNDSLFRKGFIWNYDLTKDTIFNGVKYLQHSPLEFKVSEEIVMDERVCNLIKNNKNLPNLIMYQDFEEIYLWDAQEQEFKLVYDFDAIHNYQSSIFNDCSETWDYEENFKLDGDEDDKYVFPNGINYLYLQKGLYSINSNNFSYPFEILTNKGQVAGGLYFNHSTECEPEQEIGFLRCFSHGDSNGDSIVNVTSKHFENIIDCDEVWYEVISSIESSTMGEKKLKLYPNPSNGMIKLSSIYKNINVLDIKGKLLQSYDNTDRLNLEMLPPGVYFIKTRDSVARVVLY